MRLPSSKKAGLLTCAALALLLPACQNGGNFCFLGYTTAPNYRSDIHTVRVKIFNNRTYRLGLEFEMTRAVIREIEAHTPFKVVSDSSKADTELTGTIIMLNKGLYLANTVNEQRDVEVTLGVEFVWRDLRSGEILSKPPRRPGEVVPDPPPPAVPPGPLALEGTPGIVQPSVITPPIAPSIKPGSGNGILVTTTAHFIPEIGQSLATANQVNINELAQKIRELMESPW